MMSPEFQQQQNNINEALSRIKHKILVMSGKGGVGKSCIAANLAVALAEKGYRVGLMDVDLHGPSIAQLIGMPVYDPRTYIQHSAKPKKGMTYWKNKIVPALYRKNLLVVTIDGMLENFDKAVIWRGPKKMGAIRQFIGDVLWDDLDYLVIDSPPGTGDEPLTVAQTIPDAKSVLVTTPQKVALRDVRKSVNFCRQMNMDILGVIENMSGFVCRECGARTELFNAGGGKELATEMALSFLGLIPIIPDVMRLSDAGTPPILESESFKNHFGKIVSSLESLLKIESPVLGNIK